MEPSSIQHLSHHRSVDIQILRASSIDHLLSRMLPSKLFGNYHGFTNLTNLTDSHNTTASDSLPTYHLGLALIGCLTLPPPTPSHHRS